MLTRYRLVVASLLLAAGAAHAAPSDSLMIIASPDSTQTTTTGSTAYYTRLFDVSLANVGQQPINLAKGCFKAYDRRGTAYALDIVDEALVKGSLAPGKHKKGSMGFSSLQSEVYDADVVRFSTDCAAK